MLKKNEVFVRVSSKKKAQKLKELLDMFGEPILDSTNKRLEKGIVSYEYPFVQYGGSDWSGLVDGEVVKSKVKVSISELRNILAVEHLKEGDFIVAKNGEYSFVGIFKCFDKGLFFVSNWRYLGKDEFFSNEPNDSGHLQNFLRYATEEERQLLYPVEKKREVEEGKWYVIDKADCVIKNSFDAIIFYKGCDFGYGFNHIGEWTEEYNTNNHYINKEVKREATPEEVEQALIKEAKRRYKVGDKLSEVYEDFSRGDRVFSLDLNHQVGLCDLWIGNDNGYESCIFKNGQWAEVVEESKVDNDLEQLEKILSDAQVLVYKLKNK